MKKIILILIILYATIAYSQNVGVSDDATFIPSLGLLDIKFATQTTSTNKIGINLDLSGLSGTGAFISQKIITPFGYNIEFGNINYAGFFGYHVGIDNGNELRFFNGSYYTAFNARIQSSNINYILPAMQATEQSYLENDGSGYLSWRNSPKSTMLVLHGDAPSFADNTSGYCGPSMVSTYTATESNAQIRMSSCIITNFQIYVSLNQINTGDATFNIRKNGVTVITISVPALGTGWYSQTASILFAENDLLSIYFSIPNKNGGTYYITVNSGTIYYRPQ